MNERENKGEQAGTVPAAPIWYKVVRVFKGGRREIIRRNLTEDEARALVRRYPSRPRSMVFYIPQASYSRAGTKTAR